MVSKISILGTDVSSTFKVLAFFFEVRNFKTAFLFFTVADKPILLQSGLIELILDQLSESKSPLVVLTRVCISSITKYFKFLK